MCVCVCVMSSLCIVRVVCVYSTGVSLYSVLRVLGLCLYSGLPTFTGAQMLFQLLKLCHFMPFSVKLKIMPFYSIFKATISKFSKLCHIMLFWYVFFFLRLRRLVLGKNKISKYL